MTLCNECGNPLGEKANYCAECGASVQIRPNRTPRVRDELHRGDREFWESISDSESGNKPWDAIKKSKDAEEFREYLKAFPNGAFVAMARLKLRELGAYNGRNLFDAFLD